jgi:hypothetical protein
MVEIVCELDRAAGAHSPCRGESCAFWVDSHCLLAGSRPVWDANLELVRMLRDLKRELSVPNSRSLIPPGLRE